MIASYARQKENLAKVAQMDDYALHIPMEKRAGVISDAGEKIDDTISSVQDSDTYQNIKGKVKDTWESAKGYLGKKMEDTGKGMEDMGRGVKNKAEGDTEGIGFTGEEITSDEGMENVNTALQVDDDYDWLEDPNYKDRFQETSAFSKDKTIGEQDSLLSQTSDNTIENTQESITADMPDNEEGAALLDLTKREGTDQQQNEFDLSEFDLNMEGSGSSSGGSDTSRGEVSTGEGIEDIELASLSKTGSLLKALIHEDSVQLDPQLHQAQ